MKRFAEYSEFRQSDHDWFPSIPEHWEVRKLAHAFMQIGSGTTPKSDRSEYYENGTIPWVNTGDLDDGPLVECAKKITERATTDYSTLKLYPREALLFAMYGATIGKLGVLQFPATVNQACCVFSGQSPISTRFLFYWFLGLRQEILSLATGGGQPNVSQDILRTLRVACPDKQEQKQIALFLDYETAKIDALIAMQQQLIALLGEKRQAVISHAVTKGLNPDAPTQCPNDDWFPHIPKHWTPISVRNLVRRGALQIQDGNHGESHPKAAEFKLEGIPFLMAADMNNGRNDLENCHFITEKRAAALRIPPALAGDIFLSHKGNQLGEVSIVPGEIDYPYLVLAPQITYYRVDRNLISQKFLFFVLRSKGFQGQLWFLASIQATRPYVGLLAQRDLRIALPPIEEQHEIAKRLDNEVGKFDELLQNAEDAIELLQERRTALISAAVTGKIDVRGWKPPSADSKKETETEVT